MDSRASSPATGVSPIAPRNLFVVGMDRALVDLTRSCLREDGYRVLTAPTVADALVVLSAFRFDLIVASVSRTTDEDGATPWAALDRLRAAARGVPLLIAACGERDLADYRERGFQGVVHQPFDDRALRAAIQRSGSCEVPVCPSS